MNSLLCSLVALTCATSSPSQTESTHYESGVILQYHNVSTETPDITSIAPKHFEKHLDWLEENKFEILPLQNMLSTLKEKKPFEHTHNVAITFDDAHISVCETAWPILQKRNLPFTIFVNTEAIEKNYQSQCTWKQLKEILQSGLLTIGNHGHSHQHMVRNPHQDFELWLKQSKNEILTTQNLIEKHLGLTTDLFAYPYGEYNEELRELINNLGYIGFGQHSGAVGYDSDFLALPRFPASGRFANLETLSVKLNSLAFPGELIPESKNPIVQNHTNNPPSLKLIPNKKIGKVNCYDSSTGKPIPQTQEGNALFVQHHERLTEGRHRYNCTSASKEALRFYWISYQWLVIPP